MQYNLPQIRGKYRFNVSLSKMCWFGVGGNASIVFTPLDLPDLIFFLQNLAVPLPIFVLGVGSNILVRDSGFNGVVIRLGGGFNILKVINDHTIYAGASVLDYNVSEFTMEYGIGGFEFLSGIPGTIGGGIMMNAGAYGSCFADIIHTITCVDCEGNVLSLTKNDLKFKYRASNFDKKVIFIGAELLGVQSDNQTILDKISYIKSSRASTQPVKGFKTGGSTFKNPDGYKAWKLINEAECNGLSVGGAQVSTLHCNFFINNGNATSNDIEMLIEIVREKVFKKSGIVLETEIILLGDK